MSVPTAHWVGLSGVRQSAGASRFFARALVRSLGLQSFPRGFSALPLSRRFYHFPAAPTAIVVAVRPISSCRQSVCRSDHPLVGRPESAVHEIKKPPKRGRQVVGGLSGRSSIDELGPLRNLRNMRFREFSVRGLVHTRQTVFADKRS